MNKKKNRFDFCRTCGKTGDVEIFGPKGEVLQLEEKINTYLPITVSINDNNLPLKLCFGCINKLENCHNLILSTIETQKVIDELIRKKEIKDNSLCTKNLNKDSNKNKESQPIEVIVIDSTDHDDSDCTIVEVTAGNKENELVNSISVGDDQICVEDLDIVVLGNEDVIKNHKFKCVKCYRVFEEETNLRRHILIQHDPAEMECFHCFATFNSMLLFERHVATHFPKGEILCDICLTLFTHVAALLNHLAMHKSQRKTFTCQICYKVLANRVSFMVHQRSHSSERPYACNYCKKTFAQISTRDLHERNHTGEITHGCEFCGQKFNSKLSCDTHRRIHTGELPFNCKYCSVKFRSLENLRQHEKTHATVKSFQCKVCNKRFGQQETVRMHMRTHNDEKRFKCPMCEHSYKQKKDMLKHTKKVHKRQNKQNNEKIVRNNKNVNNENIACIKYSMKEFKELCTDSSDNSESYN